jgi:hypothetical protein
VIRAARFVLYDSLMDGSARRGGEVPIVSDAHTPDVSGCKGSNATADRICDTSPEVEAYVVEGYRRMPLAAKLDRVRALNAALLSLAEADERRRHPNADQREIDLRVASRWLDAETMRRAFGWDPETGDWL